MISDAPSFGEAVEAYQHRDHQKVAVLVCRVALQADVSNTDAYTAVKAAVKRTRRRRSPEPRPAPEPPSTATERPPTRTQVRLAALYAALGRPETSGLLSRAEPKDLTAVAASLERHPENPTCAAAASLLRDRVRSVACEP